MTKALKSYERIPWENIKAYLDHPESSELSGEHKYLIDRVFSLQKVLQRFPQQRTAIAMHRAKFPDIHAQTAYNDLLCARKLENTYHTFDYEFYNNWLITDIIDQIQASKAKGDTKGWAAGHANLKRTIGERPVQETDPKLLEKHTFLIQINNIPAGVTINVDTLEKIPVDTRKKIADAVFEEISEDQAQQMLGS